MLGCLESSQGSNRGGGQCRTAHFKALTMTKITLSSIAAKFNVGQPAIPHNKPADERKGGNTQQTFGTNLPFRTRIESVETPGPQRKASLPGTEPVDALLRNATRLEDAGSAWTQPRPPSTAGKKKPLLSNGARPSASEEVNTGLATLNEITGRTAALSEALKSQDADLLKAAGHYEQAKAEHTEVSSQLDQLMERQGEQHEQLRQLTKTSRKLRRDVNVLSNRLATQQRPGSDPTGAGAAPAPDHAAPPALSKLEIDGLVRPGPDLAPVIAAWKSGAPTPDLPTLPPGLKQLDASPLAASFKEAVLSAHDAAQAQDQASAVATKTDKAHAALSTKVATLQAKVDTALATVDRLRTSRDQTVSQLHAEMQPSAQLAADLAMLHIRVAHEGRSTLQELSAIHIGDLEKAAAGDESSLVHLERRVAHAAKAEQGLQTEHEEAKKLVATLGSRINVNDQAQRAELKTAQQHMVKAQALLLDAADRHHQLSATLKEGKTQLVQKHGDLILARERLMQAKSQIDEQVRTMSQIESTASTRRSEQVGAFLNVMKQYPPGFSRGASSDEDWAKLQASASRLIDKLPPDDPTAEREVPAYVKANVLLRQMALATGGDAKRASQAIDALMTQPHTRWMPRPDAAPASSPEEAALQKDVSGLMRQLSKVDRGVAFAQHLVPDEAGASKSAFNNMVVYFRAQSVLTDATAGQDIDVDSQRWLTMAMKHASERADKTIDEKATGGRERAAFNGVSQNFTSVAPGSDYDKTAKALARIGHGTSPDDTKANSKDPLSHSKTFEMLNSAMALQGRNTPRAEANRALYLAAAQLSNAAGAEALVPTAKDRPAHEAAAGNALIEAIGEYITRHGERHGVKSTLRDVGAALHVAKRSFNGTADLSHPEAKLRSNDWKQILAMAQVKYNAAHAFQAGPSESPAQPSHPFAVPTEWKNIIRPEGKWASMTAFNVIDNITRKLQAEPTPPRQGLPDLPALTTTVKAGSLTKLSTPEQREQFLGFMMGQMEERDKVDWSHGQGAGLELSVAMSKGAASGAVRVGASVEKVSTQTLATPTFGSTLMTSEGKRTRIQAGGSGALGVSVGEAKLGLGGAAKLSRDHTSTEGGGFRLITEKNKGGVRADLPEGARLVDERNAAAVNDLRTLVQWRSMTDAADPSRPKYTNALEALLGESKSPVVMTEVRERGGISATVSADVGLNYRPINALGGRLGGGMAGTGGIGDERFDDTGRSHEKVANKKMQAAATAGAAAYATISQKTEDDLTLRGVHPIIGKLYSTVIAMTATKDTTTNYDVGFQRLSGSSEMATSKAKDVAKLYDPMIVDSALRWIDAMPAQREQTREDQLRQAMELHDHWSGFLSSVKLNLSEQATLKHEQRPLYTGVPGGARAMADTAAAEGDLLGSHKANAAANAFLDDPTAHSMKTSAVKAQVTRATTAMTPPVVGMVTSASAYVSTTQTYYPPVRGHIGEAPDPAKGHFSDSVRNAVKPLPPRAHVLSEAPAAAGGDASASTSTAPGPSASKGKEPL